MIILLLSATHIEINFGFKVSIVIDKVLNVAVMRFKIQMTLGLHHLVIAIVIVIIVRFFIRTFGFLVRIVGFLIWVIRRIVFW